MKNLLIVDDSKFMRAIIKKAVEGLDLNIFEAESVDQALAVFETEKIDIMTLDITMEGKSGADYIEEFVNKNKDLKVFVCSSMTATEMIQRVLLAGAHDFVKKPFKNDVLRQKIINVM